MRAERQPCVYILASRPCRTFCVGVTSDLFRSLRQHRTDAAPGFTARHAVRSPVRYALFEDMERAILSEKQLKRWRRDRKINLIEDDNARWAALAVRLGRPPPPPALPHDGC